MRLVRRVKYDTTSNSNVKLAASALTVGLWRVLSYVEVIHWPRGKL